MGDSIYPIADGGTLKPKNANYLRGIECGS